MALIPTTLPQAPVPRQRGIRLPGDSGVDGGVNALAEGVAALQRAGEERQARADRLALIGASTTLRARETERLVAEGDALKEDELDGFQSRFSAGFDTTAAEARAALPARVQGEFDAIAGEARADFALKAGEVERARRVTRETRTLDEQLEASSRTVATDATQFDKVLDAATAAITSSNLPEALKAARLDRLPNTLARERFVGLMQSDPDAVAHELEDPRWTALFTPEQKLALQHDARTMKTQLERDAIDAIEPAANQAINRIIGNPAHFVAELTALRESPALARVPASVREDVIRRVAARGAEARLQTIGESNPWAARQELLSGQHDAYIDAGDKGRLLSSLNNDIQQRAARAEAQARADRMERAAIEGDGLLDEMQSAVASRMQTGRATPIDRGRIVAVFGERKAAEFDDALNEAGSLHANTMIMRRLPANDVASFVAGFAPKAGAATYAGDARFHAALTKVAVEELALRRADPAGAALRRPEVSRALEIFQQTGSPGARQNYVRATRATQTALGVPVSAQRIVPASAVAAAVGRLQAAGPDRRAAESVAVVEELQQAWGPNAGEAIARVAAPVNAGGAGLPELAALAPIAHRTEARRIASALAAPPVQLLKPDADAVRLQVAREIAPLIASFEMLPGGQQRATAVRAAVEKVARADVATGRNPQDAARAAAGVFMAEVQIEDGVRLPRTWRGAPLDATLVLQGAEALRDRLVDEDRIDMPVGDPRLEGKAKRAAVRAAVLADTRWIAAPDDRGLILWDNHLGVAVKGADGAPVRADFNALLQEDVKPKPLDDALYVLTGVRTTTPPKRAR